MDGDFPWGDNAELYPATVCPQNRYGDAVSDGDTFSRLAAENQHFLFLRDS
jgi:hypothetical protein